MKSFKQFLLETPNIDSQLKKLGLSRSKFGVGKVMNPFIYVHKNYISDFPKDVQQIINKSYSLLPKKFEFTAIKYGLNDNSVSFIYSPDFDTSDEPIVGDSIKVTTDGKVSITKMGSDPLIWHHKWQWVKDDYPGFDVQQSKERSLKWKSLLGVNKDISNRIGRLSYWKKWTEENGL